MTSTKGAQERASPPFPHLDVLMSNPQVMPNLSSFFSAQPLPLNYIPNYMPCPSGTGKVEYAPSPAKAVGDDDQQPGASNLSSSKKMKERTFGVLKEREFNRMSFNPKLRREAAETSVGIAEESEDNFDEDQERNEGSKPQESEESSRRKAERTRSSTFDGHPTSSCTPQQPRAIESLFKEKDKDSSATLVIRPNNLDIKKPNPNLSHLLTEPPSSHLATAMYPPRKSGIPLHVSRVRKRFAS
ncbi:unnamed protein product [Toxocara canis]|uniref:Uncharacterized protein n=1 Tax=Toxocara canis TaxID=6265 RepID=A0A183U3E6_TOXCA|nr:unnamed protein product [Toxocara canis]